MVVQAVCCEPVSPEFPVKQGKNREFSRNRPKMASIWRSNDLISQGYLTEFPTKRNREIFRPNRNIKLRNREFTNLQSLLSGTRRSRAIAQSLGRISGAFDIGGQDADRTEFSVMTGEVRVTVTGRGGRVRDCYRERTGFAVF